MLPPWAPPPVPNVVGPVAAPACAVLSLCGRGDLLLFYTGPPCGLIAGVRSGLKKGSERPLKPSSDFGCR